MRVAGLIIIFMGEEVEALYIILARQSQCFPPSGRSRFPLHFSLGLRQQTSILTLAFDCI